MKTAPTDKKTAKPFGALSLFPREIRNGIYRHSLPTKEYYWSRILQSSEIYESVLYWRRQSSSKRWSKFNLPVLCLSNAIKEEAMDSLYLNGTFVFQSCLGETGEKIPQHSTADKMRKIEIFYTAALDPDMDFESDLGIDYNTSLAYGSAEAGPLYLFCGDAIARNSILIVLKLCHWWRHATAMTESLLFEALQQLTGFETVTLRLVAAYDMSCWEWPRDEEWAELYTGFGDILSEMSMSLEPTLGKICAMSELLPEQIGPSLEGCGIREVVFHPRKHRATISKAKKDK